MTYDVLFYFGITALLALVMLGLIIYYYSGNRKEHTEQAKFSMMEDYDED